jgi:dienelactone hydrolase
MLFLQGTRDTLAELDQLEPVMLALEKRATFKLFDGADHAFHVPRRTGKTDADIRREMVDTLAGWVEQFA